MLCPALAVAQTWTGGTTPALPQLFAVDATGETGWLYGQEDLAGDGLDSFKQQEQSIDIRTAYAATDTQSFWFRVYVSDTAQPGGNVSAYVFIDSDKSASTGGSAAATDVDARFTTDASNGGYEYVFGVRGNQSVVGLWEWRPQTSSWATKQINANAASAEAGTDTDPILLNGAVHGYLQGKVDLTQVGLDSACAANLYVRTTNETAALGAGDLEVGQVGACVPADANNNGVPDPVEPKTGCTTDAQCPNGGVCVGGKCILAQACGAGVSCDTGYTCVNGRCVVQPTGTCTDNAACNGAVCVGGQCVACTPGGTECGAGRTCGPDGRCVGASGNGGSGGASGVALGPDDEIQGGACTCNAPGRSSRRSWLFLTMFPLAWLVRRSRRSLSH